MRGRRTFTLIELLITVAVLSVLAGIALVGYSSVTSRAADKKMIVRSTSVLQEAQVLYKQKSFTDPAYTWTQAVADAVDDLPPYVTSAWSEGVEATGLSSGSNGWTVTLDTGVAVFSSAPNEFVVYEVEDTVYIASAVNSNDVTRAVYGYVSSAGVPRVWIARCGGSTCDARTPTVSEPINDSYPVGTRVASVPGDVRSVSIALASGSYTDVVMSFSSPTDDGGAAIDAYRGTCTSSNGGLTRTNTNTASPVTVTGLTLGKEYTCSAAAHNSTGWGAETTSTSPLSIMSPPDAPSITGITGGVASLTVAYTLGESNGGSDIASVEYSLDSGAWVAFSGATSPQTITGLTAGSTYSVRIRSLNATQTSTASSAVSGSAYSAPDAPAITSITGGSSLLTVAYTLGASNGGSAVTSVEYSLDSGAWVAFSGATSPQTITGLTAGSTYSVRIRSVNAAAPSAASSAVSGSAYSAPDAPAITSITGGSSLLTVAYTPGASNGGSAVTSVEYSLDSGAWVAFSGATSPQTITGLTAGSTYSVRIRSVNAAAPSAASSAVSGSAYSVPGAPTITGVTGTDGALSVSFTSPSSNGGSVITSYQYSLDSGAWVALSGTTSPQSITGLSIQTYYVRVRAVNAIGAGSASNSHWANANGPPPAPGSFSATAASSSQINVSWTYTDPGDLSSFTVLRSDGWAVIGSIAKTSRSASVTGLSQNSAYSYYVVAVDAAGNTSPASATASATTSNAAPPMSGITWEDGGAGADSAFNHRVCWNSDATNEVLRYRVVIDGGVHQDIERGGGWSGGAVCSGWVSHAYMTDHTWYVQAVDDYGATTNSNTRTVRGGYNASAVYGWVEVSYTTASNSLTINNCSAAGSVYKDPYYNKVTWAEWVATIMRGGSPYYDLTSGTRAMQRRTSGGYAGWGPVGTGQQSFYQNRGEDYQSASGGWSGHWGSRANPATSPCYWNTTYPTRFVVTIGYNTRNYQVTSAAWTTNPVYG
jgi:prepilin-type N-terminal cleavage/methylation domain-containing protein